VLVPNSGPNNYAITVVAGTVEVAAPWKLPNGRGSARCPRIRFRFRPDAEGVLELRVDGFVSRLPPVTDVPFDDVAAAAAADFATWLARAPAAACGRPSDRARAAYVNWASMVPPGGILKRPAMLMSKAHMRSVWSWDHCFNAMALAYGDGDQAWNQLMVPADHQDENGFMPDSLNDSRAAWHHGKPPVHGWAVDFCMQRNPDMMTKTRLQKTCRWLHRWTNWWMENRLWDGMPFYTHGNDSGWDNATIFDVGSPTASPDLAAHLAVQMDVLARLATRLGRGKAAGHWRKRSDAMVDLLLDRFWRGDRFVGIHCPTGRDVDCDSLITCLPIVLGDRLPRHVVKALTKRIRSCTTSHGVATQDPASAAYDTNFHAYWRGSVWAPSTMLVVDGLRRAGEEALSRRIARGACRAMARHHFRENWDPLTGDGRMELAYTWTSSVYLVLAHEYV
jgi:glycogen debranching enzyme